LSRRARIPADLGAGRRRQRAAGRGNARSREVNDEAKLLYASDIRGERAVFPRVEAGFSTLEIPSTLPTFDEFDGAAGVSRRKIVAALSSLLRDESTECLHAARQIEGMAGARLFANARRLSPARCGVYPAPMICARVARERAVDSGADQMMGRSRTQRSCGGRRLGRVGGFSPPSFASRRGGLKSAYLRSIRETATHGREEEHIGSREEEIVRPDRMPNPAPTILSSLLWLPNVPVSRSVCGCFRDRSEVGRTSVRPLLDKRRRAEPAYSTRLRATRSLRRRSPPSSDRAPESPRVREHPRALIEPVSTPRRAIAASNSRNQLAPAHALDPACKREDIRRSSRSSER